MIPQTMTRHVYKVEAAVLLQPLDRLVYQILLIREVKLSKLGVNCEWNNSVFPQPEHQMCTIILLVLVFTVDLSVSVVTTASSIPGIPASTWSTRISPSTMSAFGEASLLLILCCPCHVRPSYFSPNSLQVSPCEPRSERGDSAAGRGE